MIVPLKIHLYNDCNIPSSSGIPHLNDVKCLLGHFSNFVLRLRTSTELWHRVEKAVLCTKSGEFSHGLKCTLTMSWLYDNFLCSAYKNHL